MNPGATRLASGSDRSDDSDRGRLREALVAVIDERGYSQASLELVLDRAGIARRGFERCYPSLDACFAEVWNGFAQEFVDRALAVYAAAGDWLEGMRAQAWEYCRFLAEDPLRARICMVEVAFGGEPVQASRDVFMEAYVELIHLGRHEREGGAELPRARAEGIVGAIWERVAATVSADQFERLPEQVPQMMYLTVLPYLGAEAAREELQRGPADLARYRRGEL